MRTSEIKYGIVNQSATKPSFRGHVVYTTDSGEKAHKFFQPYNTEKYTAEIEFVPLQYDVKTGYWTKDANARCDSEKKELPSSGAYVRHAHMLKHDANKEDIKDKGLGYRYIFTEKSNPNNKIYAIDQGVVSKVGNGEYNVISNTTRPILTRNGLSKQVFPDICMPGYRFDRNKNIVFDKTAYERAYKSLRTHGNKLGGNFAGIVKMLPQWEKEGYTKIVGTPFTRDDVSSHLYWTQNVYQVSPNLGTIDDFKILQTELFKHGMNWIADGAFVNQGMQGVQFRSLLKHGTDSPFFYWFKAEGLRDNPLILGLFPQNASEYTRFRLVNAPETMYESNGVLKFQRNENYNSTKPTYIQMYDARLVTEQDLSDKQKLLTMYSKTNTNNTYDITNHDEITQLVAVPIDYELFRNHAEKAYNNTIDPQKSLSNPETLREMLNFNSFKIGYKDKGGIELWDGNMDIAKLNFCVSNVDQRAVNRGTQSERAKEIKNQKAGAMQVQDFAIQAGKYWTRLTADTQFEYIANTLAGLDGDAKTYSKQLTKLVEAKKLPKHIANVINKNVLENAIEGEYVSLRKSQVENLSPNKRNFIANEIMNFPLDTIEFGWDLTATLSSPFISKRAINEKQLNLTRYELMQQYQKNEENLLEDTASTYKKTDNFLKTEFTDLALSILNSMDKSSQLDADKKLFNGNKVTEYGQYIIPLIMPDLVKYITVKSFAPFADITFYNGKFNYSKARLDNISLHSLNIGGSPEFEAERVLAKYKNGVLKLQANPDLKNDLAKTLINRIKNVSLENLQVAEAILDKSESGLGWRLDAAKDIANIDALKTSADATQATILEITKFWSHFNQAVLKENPHAYSTAEITDLAQFFGQNNARKGQYDGFVDAETKLIEQTGINNTANYMFFYSLLKNLFGKNEEHGFPTEEFAGIKFLKDKLDGTCKRYNSDEPIWRGSKGFLYTYPDDSITNSYTFIGNHDKPRPLHIFALDMELFHSAVESDGFGNVTSGKTHAMAKRINQAVYEAFDYEYRSDDDTEKTVLIKKPAEKANQLRQKHAHNIKAIEKALDDIKNGQFQGKYITADAFGTKPIDKAIDDVIAQAKLYGFDMNSRDEQRLKDITFELILKPAMDRFKSAYKMLVTLPGSPTDFLGDKEASTGYETKSNNDYQQNRNFVHHEWANQSLKDQNIKQNKNKQFVNDFYNEITKIGKLRRQDSLSALKNGTTISLKMQGKEVGLKTGEGDVVEQQVYGTFRYDDTGSQVITLYTTSGATLDNTKPMERKTVAIKEIKLDREGLKQGLPAGLKEGTTFFNANPDDSYYKVVVEQDGTYKVKRFKHRTNEQLDIEITPQDLNTLVLFKKDPIPYTAKKRIEVDLY